MSRHPMIKWAQRSDKVYLTVELPDAKDVKVKLEPEGKFIFHAKKDGDTTYEVDMELYEKINAEESKVSIGVRSIVYVIVKTEKKWWPRLVKQEGKAPVFLKVDWDKWVDEDEEHAKAGMDFDGMDFSEGRRKRRKPGKGRWKEENLLQRLLRMLRIDCVNKM